MSEQAVPEKTCERAQALLPDYWQGDLDAEDRAWLEQHLQACSPCSELAAFWNELGDLPQAAPDPSQRRRFQAMLAAYQADQSRHSWRGVWEAWLRPLPVALSLLVLLVGFGAGWWLRSAVVPSVPNQAAEIAALRDEVHAANQLVVLSMLQQQSANDRLQGVSYSRRLDQSDPRIVQALLHSLQSDPSPGVRLAALDALQSDGGARSTSVVVMGGLVDAFQYQQSPLVQVALVDSFLQLRPPAARALLERISSDSTYAPEVRQRAQWGLSHWN